MTGDQHKRDQGKAASRLTLAKAISQCLELNIEKGILKPGSVLLGTELARVFNVSRIPVAEALQLLVEQGIIAKRAAQGYSVVGGDGGEEKPDLSTLVVPKDLVTMFDRQPSWERIYSQIEEELVSLMPYGSFRINESSMTSYYGVNRNIIQLVVSRLCERGIAEKPSQSRCHLLAYDEAYVTDGYQLRAILEPSALRLAAPSIPMRQIRSSLEAHRKVEADFERLAKTWLTKLEDQIHISFLSRCPNHRILTALAGAQAPLIPTTKMIRRVLGELVEQPLVAEHIAILEPLAEGDSERAAEMLKLHLELSISRSIDRLPILAALPRPRIPSFLRER